MHLHVMVNRPDRTLEHDRRRAYLNINLQGRA